MLASIPLTDDERAAVDDGHTAVDALLARLADVPPPPRPPPPPRLWSARFVVAISLQATTEIVLITRVGARESTSHLAGGEQKFSDGTGVAQQDDALALGVLNERGSSQGGNLARHGHLAETGLLGELPDGARSLK
jgi:hypothetical protein